MISENHLASLQSTLREIDSAGLCKRERLIDSPQNSTVRLKDGRTVINLCANNYLGLADHPEVLAAAKSALDRWGFGMASVRFICGTQTLHKQLEEKSPLFSAPRTPFSIRPVSMPTAGFSRSC
jgi:glycine C-acetyltransferase